MLWKREIMRYHALGEREIMRYHALGERDNEISCFGRER